MQLDEPVGIVGEYGGPGADQRALATQFIVDVVPGQQARDQPLRLRVALANGKRPGGGKQQPRPGLGLGARDDPEPVLHVIEPPPDHQRVVEAALCQLVGPVAPTRGESVLRGGSHQPVGRQPLRDAGLDLGPFVGGERVEPVAQRLPGERMKPHPVALLAGDKHRRGGGDAAKALRRVRRAGRCGGEGRTEVFEDGNPREECEVRGIEVGEQQSDEPVVQRALLLEQRLRGCARIAIGRHHRKDELYAEGPAIGHLVQPDRDAQVEICPEALPNQFD